jgi:hypothetical protein
MFLEHTSLPDAKAYSLKKDEDEVSGKAKKRVNAASYYICRNVET